MDSPVVNVERVTGLEPVISCLGSKRSTTELHPLATKPVLQTGFEGKFGGICNSVGAPGVEPGTSCTPCKRASRTALRPERTSRIIAYSFCSGNPRLAF